MARTEVLRRGFTSTPNYILNNTSLSIAARFTYIVLLSFAWKEGSCFPGQTRLAKTLGVSRRMINRYLNELREKGFIDWERRGLGRTNVYRLLRIKPTKSEADVKHSLHQDVKQGFHQDVKQGLHKEYEEEEYSERKDSDNSKFRKVSTSNKRGAENRSKGERELGEDTEVPNHQENARKGRISGKIAQVLEHLSNGKLHDPEHVKSNITRALNIFAKSKLTEEEFIDIVREAFKITLSRSESIKKKAGYMGLKNRAPYFFQVLEDQLYKTSVEKFRHDLIKEKSMT